MMFVLIALLAAVAASASEAGRGEVYSVIDLTFRGPRQTPVQSPAREVDFSVRFRHESGAPEYTVHGFWDGDDVFRVRFCPTRPGRWNIAEVQSNAAALNGQRQGHFITAVPSKRHGFWIADTESPGSRWYKRSDGSHQYITGNTHYSFLSGYRDNGPTRVAIADDIARNAQYFRKLRFSLHGDRYPHPSEKLFFDDHGEPTDRGDESHRPNPKWFRERADVAVRASFDHDLIADVILAGPDTVDSRSTLKASGNGGDPTPYLKYVAARYGSYPNVWICLSNEYDIKTPSWTPKEIARFGEIIRSFLPYPTPLSVHPGSRLLWAQAFDDLPAWHDHHIIQRKLRNIAPAADVLASVGRNRPAVNDELSYQGDGDKHSEHDTIEAHLGAFLGGGYATTGFKPGNKLGHYFWGSFDPAEHTAAVSLGWLRKIIDGNIAFWKMSPDQSIFSSLDDGFRAMAWPGREYVLGTNSARQGMVAMLPAGNWTVTRYDVISRSQETLTRTASGRFMFDSPASRAVLTHFKRN